MAFKPTPETAHLFHVKISREEYDPATGKPLFIPFVQTFTPDEYRLFLKHPHGYSVKEVLHDPTKPETSATPAKK